MQCLDSFFEEVNLRNLWKTTMIEYVRWQRKIENLKVEETVNSTHFTITLNECVKGLTLKIKTSKKKLS